MRSFIVIGFAALFLGCSMNAEPNMTRNKIQESTEDGGGSKTSEQDKVEQFFLALTKVQSEKEEKQVLTEFGHWLTERGYKIRVEESGGRYNLACPYFPPVTPWAGHSFYNVQNLELLPQFENKG